MDRYMERYMDHLVNHGKKSKNTLDAYRRDICEFRDHLKGKGVTDVNEVTNADVVSFMMELKDQGRAGSTINRKMAALRSYFEFLCREDILHENPAANIKPPKNSRKELDYLTIEEIERILSAPDDSPLGLRDRAILEMLYGTGIRVTEITELRLSDVNFRIGYVTCNGDYGKARIIPIGRPCRKALEEYMDRARATLISGKSAAEVDPDGSPFLFVNYHGEKLTRQGLWKIIRKYSAHAGIEGNLTPQILRNSFAVHMVQNGADLKSIQELMGYEDVSTTEIYLRVTKNRIKEVYDRTHPRA